MLADTIKELHYQSHYQPGGVALDSHQLREIHEFLTGFEELAGTLEERIEALNAPSLDRTARKRLRSSRRRQGSSTPTPSGFRWPFNPRSRLSCRRCGTASIKLIHRAERSMPHHRRSPETFSLTGCKTVSNIRYCQIEASALKSQAIEAQAERIHEKG